MHLKRNKIESTPDIFFKHTPLAPITNEGEKALYRLLWKKARTMERIMESEIKEIWMKRVRRCLETFDRYGKNKDVPRPYIEKEIRTQALQWSRSAMGRLVNSGHLILAPSVGFGDVVDEMED